VTSVEYFALIAALLFLLAILDLAVGVSNDAVNFLNSAIGSRVATRRTIMIVASAGIVLGALTSSGLMEVARNGIFHPEKFTFADIMVLFLAVMLADVLLLDAFNSLALPTSTTVSIVFELLGAAVGLAFLTVLTSDAALSAVMDFINLDQAALIILGIFLSIGIAFAVGLVVQFVSRVLFTFDVHGRENRHRLRFWAAVAFSALSYFLVIKGLGNSPALPETLRTAAGNFGVVPALGLFVVWLAIAWLLQGIGINLLRAAVLFGTFALAMAFAGNDLVNFIGVPLAGLASFNAWQASGEAPESLSMSMLNQPVVGETHWLLLAGIVMAVTLWLSARAKAVTETEVNLGRQYEGSERFRAGPLSRALVRGWMALGSRIVAVIPTAWTKRLAERLLEPPVADADDRPAFDLLRASVNLTVASLLIAVATSLKLPLSTTYVSFMVAMGTSLADGAWGRESAVFRVAGVLSVIGGWLLTAVIAFATAAVFAVLMRAGGVAAIGVMVVLVAAWLVRSHNLHRQRLGPATPGSV